MSEPLIVTRAEFPHGLRCVACDRLLLLDDPALVLKRVIEEDVSEIVCWECGNPPTQGEA